MLNTDFAGHQLGEVLEREGAAAAIFDDEFLLTFDEAGFDGIRVDGTVLGNADPCPDPPDPPERPSRIVIMTSGTTGTPKGSAP